MDILILILLICIIAIFSFYIAFSEGKPLKKRMFGAVGTTFTLLLFYTIYLATQAANYESLNFELVEKIPFEWNKAHQSYFFYHDGEWKACEQYVDHFDERMVKKYSDYDSCYVYKVEMPKIMRYFDTRWWTPEFEYRQSEDILLLHREKRTIELK